jgi:stress-induced morphogen
VRVYQFRHIRWRSQCTAESRRHRRRPAPRYDQCVSKERMQSLLENAFPDAQELLVIDRGGGDHFEVRVTAPEFDGLTRIQQHKLVYEALDEPWKDGSIHELRINTKGTRA